MKRTQIQQEIERRRARKSIIQKLDKRAIQNHIKRILKQHLHVFKKLAETEIPDFESMTVKELSEYARKLDISGRSKMKKDELSRSVKETWNERYGK